MANVRKDSNGIPKAAVFEHNSYETHRTSVTTVDSTYPVNTNNGIESDGWEVIDFDIEVVSITGDDPSIEVAPIYWNPSAEKWFKGESEFLTETGNFRLRAESRGSIAYLAVESFVGTNFSINVWTSKS